VATASAAPAPCTVSVAIFPHELTAEITSTQPNAVTFSGNITVDKPSSMRVVVNLAVTVSTGWSSSVAPGSMVFAGGGQQQSFALTIVVPAGTPADEVGNVVVDAAGTGGGLSCTPGSASCVVVPAAYYEPLKAKLSPTEALASGTPPSKLLALNLSVETNVNSPISVAIEVEVPQGATHDAPSLVQLAPGPNMTVRATVNFRVKLGDLPMGTYTIVVRATRSGSSEAAITNATVSVPPKTLPSDVLPGAGIGALAAAAAAALVHRRGTRG